MTKPFSITPENSTFIKGGGNGLVYRISEDMVVKIPKHRWFKERLSMEYQIQGKVYHSGYPVPEPYGISPVIFGSSEECMSGLFMSLFPGTDLEDITGDIRPLMKEAQEIVDDIKYNLKIEIAPFYSLKPRNVMYNYDKKQIGLIDFGFWDSLV